MKDGQWIFTQLQVYQGKETNKEMLLGGIDNTPPIAEALYQLKYCNDKSKADVIARTVSGFLDDKKEQLQIDVIVPVPPSDTNRTYQPVYEMANAISAKSGLSVDNNTLRKAELKQPLKTIDDPEERREILKDVFNVENNAFDGKNVLLFDDIYRSGETLNAITNVIKNKGNAKSVFVLTVTKTRTKR
jgi:predicted amidophosphoribosyltransferase